MPVTDIALLKAHLNIVGTEDDTLLSQKLAAAEAFATSYCGETFTDPLPAAVEQAVLMLAAHWYENREAAVVGATASTIPFGVHQLLSPHRVQVTGYVPE